MRDHHHFLFYADFIDSPRIWLDPGETRHAVSVLRLRPGAPFLATDGAGTTYECILEKTENGRSTGTITGRTSRPRHDCSIHLFAGIPEREAFAELLRDLTALGVERITPLESAFCQRPWWRDGEENISARFHSKMVAAMKQSHYPWLPKLDPPLAFEKLDNSSFSGFPLLADQNGVPFSTAAKSIPAVPPFTCIVGPPGGFSSDETTRLQELGALPIKLAASRLTTELAAVVITSEVMGARLRGEG